MKDSLCCCEYENMQGERSHVLACCCDCEAIDTAVDRFLKCEKVSDSIFERIVRTVSDRCRIPSCFGRGAIKVPVDVFLPIVTVPACLCVATFHPVFTVICFLFMPLFVVGFHAVWRRGDRQRRTSFFYSWALTSVIFVYLVFQIFVVAFREVLLWEILLVFTMTATMLYLLRQIRQDPGVLKVASKGMMGHKRTPSNVQMDGHYNLYDQVPGHDAGTDQNNSPHVYIPVNESATGVRSESYCSICLFHKPPRAGHCNICHACVDGRDHHCVWIDSCVGASNHYNFILAMILLIVTGFYGVHLTLTTICTPKMYFDWFLFANDCRWLYIDFMTSMCFVTAIYTVIVSTLVFFGLLFQVILISQNVTAHELVHASRQGRAFCGLFVLDNSYNKGFVRNWVDFLFLHSRTGDSGRN